MKTSAQPEISESPKTRPQEPEPVATVAPAADADARGSRGLWGWALLVGSIVFALSRAMSASYPPPKHTLTDAERIEVGRAAAREEPGWREKSRKSFPGDAWSQDDDFHNSERSWVQQQARRRNVSAADILRAIDEDLHAHPPEPPRRATSAQCKPRPFYD